MSRRSQEKRKARSKEKKLAKRRLQGMSPLARLAGTAEGTCECWMQYDKEDDRTRNLIAIRPVFGGGSVAGFFLIDMDCLGVKDAFVRRNVDAAWLKEQMRERSREDGTTFVKITLGEMRGRVASAMRWTQAHPFRLPAETFEAVKLLGEALDLENASTTEFGTEEGLFYYGYEEDLEKALKGVSLDEFLDREDVDWEFVDDVYDDDDEANYDEGEEFEEDEMVQDEETREVFQFANAMVQILAADVRQWYVEKGVAPAAELERAVQIHVASMLAALTAMTKGGTDEEARKESLDIFDEMLDRQDPELIPALEVAFEQILASGKADAERLFHLALEEVKRSRRAIVDVPMEHTLPTEPSCSTPDTPNLPAS
jgi:hypothetical protein